MAHVGSTGEALAAQYLTSKGYSILQRNYRTRYGELDLVTEKNGTIVFVEVKTRRSDVKGKPYMAVTARKLRHLNYVMQSYLTQTKSSDKKCRLDVISINLEDENSPQIAHYESIDIL